MSDWAIPQQAKLKYTQLFNLHDRNRSGFLSGLQCRDILVQSGLARSVLAEIWNLSDIDSDGQLNREEFILAMHLTNQVRAGQPLPAELPPDLVPPSYRRTRSTSSASLKSSTIPSVKSLDIGVENISSPTKATSNAPVSALTTNSFEDKRKENFEKGRAELEKRRLRILEDQAVLLRDQLEQGKKQVADIKSKIDTMRLERDSKMGIITTLEAQLQDLKYKNTNLVKEDANLTAVEHDLNLAKAAAQSKKQREKQQASSSHTISHQVEAKFSEPINTFGDEFKSDNLHRELVDKKTDVSGYADPNAAWDSEPTANKSQAELNAESLSTYQFEEDPWSGNSLSKAFATSVNVTDDQGTFGRNPTSFEANNNIRHEQQAQAQSGFTEFHQDTLSDTSNQASIHVKKYRAVYSFESRNVDELTINPGDLIVATGNVCEPGWLSGTLNGKTGLFPETYVEVVADDFTNDHAMNNMKAPLGGEDQASDTTNDTNELTPSNSSARTITTATSTAIKYKALYSFEARGQDELSINPGDVITAIEGTYEPGWQMGELNGVRGLFPEAYVERLVVADDSLDRQSESGSLQRINSQGSLRSKKSRAKKAEVATVIANYKAPGQEQLSLEKGQLVQIRRKMDSGWWEGEIQIKGKKKQFGWFPASYVKVLSSSGGSVASSDPAAQVPGITS